MIFMIIVMIFFHQKILFFVFVCIKCLILTKKHENNNIEAIIDGIGMLWLNEKHIEEKLGHKNLIFVI